MPHLQPDADGFVTYNGLRLPLELAAMLGASAAPSLDSHVATDSVPLGHSDAREISSGEAQGPPIGGAVDRHEPAIIDGRVDPAAPPLPLVIPPVSQAHPVLARRSAPPPVPRSRLAAPRLCGECRQPGHTTRTCPVLGRAPPDFNRNALEVTPLVPHVRRSAAPALPAAGGASPQMQQHAAGDAPSDRPDDGDSRDGSVGSQSGSEEDEVAAAGFEDVTWKLVFDSTLPASAVNECPSPNRRDRQRRRSDGDASSSSSDGMSGAPPFQRDQQQPGARRIPRECKTPYDFVQLLFPDAHIDQIAHATNAAAKTHPRLREQVRFANWKDVTRQEMLRFMAICVFLGVVKVQNRKLIWRRGGVFHQEWVGRVMKLRRFECLLNAFNCSSTYWLLSDDEMAARHAENCWWQIENLVEECNRRCAFHYKMGRAFSIDEAVIPWKGRHKARCYNPKKPAKYHLKKFSLNCAATGYVYCHYHYGGKDERRPANVSASLWPIKKLVDQCPELHNKSHLCSTDNWYTSAQSLSYFRSKGIHCTGTIKRSRLTVETAKRPGFPVAATFKAVRGQPKRARADCMIYSTTVDGHDAFVTSWQDKKPVTLLSSYRPSAGECVRKVKVARAWSQQRFFRPNVIAHYNKTMGGTDLHDQHLAIARSTVKSRRWQVRVVTAGWNRCLTLGSPAC
jgi:hypothetical protein